MDYNLNKGRIIFWDTINKQLNNFTPEEQERIKELATGFENNVGVMPIEDENIYAAKRLANSLLEVGPLKNDGNIDIVPVKILDKYKLSNTNVNINKSDFIPDDTNLNGKFGKTIVNSGDEFENEIRSFVEEEQFDLLDDIDNSELSIEGMRKKILIPSNFNADKDELPKFTLQNNFGKVHFSDDGQIEKVECAFCSSFDVYFIAHNKFGCFNCDKEFLTPMEMGDLLN